MFYMCQLWALHVFIKRQFFSTFIIMTYLREAVLPGTGVSMLNYQEIIGDNEPVMQAK